MKRCKSIRGLDVTGFLAALLVFALPGNIVQAEPGESITRTQSSEPADVNKDAPESEYPGIVTLKLKDLRTAAPQLPFSFRYPAPIDGGSDPVPIDNMPILHPDSETDYKILACKPDPSIDYKILISRPLGMHRTITRDVPRR